LRTTRIFEIFSSKKNYLKIISVQNPKYG